MQLLYFFEDRQVITKNELAACGLAETIGAYRTGRIAKVDLFHTTFDLDDGTREVRPNAWLMRKRFSWGAPPPPPQPEPSEGGAQEVSASIAEQAAPPESEAAL